MFDCYTKGFSLVELLITLTISITGMTGLMRYHQTLVLQFSQASELQQVWQTAQQLLEHYPASMQTLPKQWHYQFSRLPAPSLMNYTAHRADCEMVKVQVTSPLNRQAELTRLIC